MSEVVKIENNTIAAIYLFATETFPAGIRLLPGLNTVPTKYLEELKSHIVASEGKNGKAGKPISPGVLLLEDLQQSVRYVTMEGTKYGPRITIYSDDQAGREDGPVPPADLRGYTDAQALVAVKLTSDVNVLKRWASDPRRDVKNAIAAKLAGANG
jgi:hypothetical protein